MNRIILFAISVLIVLVESEAYCSPWQEDGTINVCKFEGKKKCLQTSSSNSCINLFGGPFVSGYSSGSYNCTIYERVGCKGNSQSVDQSGHSKFLFNAAAYKCPCI